MAETGQKTGWRGHTPAASRVAGVGSQGGKDGDKIGEFYPRCTGGSDIYRDTAVALEPVTSPGPQTICFVARSATGKPLGTVDWISLEKAAGAFLADPYPNPSPLDVANLIMGNELFTAFYEEPDRLHRLLDHLTAEVIRNVRAVQAALRNPHGGTLTFNAWIPQGVLLLEDAADLCSPEIYRQFGQPRTARVIAACGGGYIHHHNLGRQQYANLAAIPGLTVLQISGDPNQPRPATDIEYLRRQVGSMPIDTEVTPTELRKHIYEFRQGRFILKTSCSSLEEARDLVALARTPAAT